MPSPTDLMFARLFASADGRAFLKHAATQSYATLTNEIAERLTRCLAYWSPEP
jgi:hypothetical protein